ncbi:hypothetical protein NP493_848g03026 [Ridgeia piscesae]|uniref:Uncharacterized protein n=1 Tax=Ridgeia piscesae TaxID=27915 RepID=A0AAD9KMG4_RIDPI|nr:hypothetical protein NP493_848g03026 [Ridgeia piscesae]
MDLKCYRVSKAGPHTVYPAIPTLDTLTVTCDQTDVGGGWTVWLNRDWRANSTDFETRTWNDYKTGFGRQDGGRSEFWLGNEIVHLLTKNYASNNGEIRVVGIDYNGIYHGISASKFSLGSESERYVLRLDNEQDSANVAVRLLAYHKDKPMTTGSKNCSKIFRGVYWWYDACVSFYLFGSHSNTQDNVEKHIFMMGPDWAIILLRQARMLFRPIDDKRTCDNPCLNGGTCEYLPIGNRHRCICPSSHCGTNCETASPCRNGGTCIVDRNTSHCICPPSHCSADCETAHLCENGGTCKYIVSLNEHRCICPQSHCGAKCETPNMCENAGTCLYDATANNYSCKCHPVFTGPNCSLVLNDMTTPPVVTIKVIVIIVIIVVFVLLIVALIGYFLYFLLGKLISEEEEETEVYARRPATSDTDFMSGLFDS